MSKRGVIFKEAPVIKPRRSWFDDSHKHDTTLNFGELAIGHCSDHLASEVLKIKNDSFGRMETMLSPTIGECDLMSYWFYVNKRHIWPDWKKFRPNNDQLKTWEQMRTFVSPTMPYIDLNDMYDITKFSDSPLDYSDGELYNTLADYPCAYLALSYDFDGIYYKFYIDVIDTDHDVLKPIPTVPTTRGSKYLGIMLVWYLYNFQDIQSKAGNKWYKYDSLVKACNIFSPGTPFNYMGVSLKSLQIELTNYYIDGVLGILENQYSVDSKVFNGYKENVGTYNFLNNHYPIAACFINDDKSIVQDDNMGFFILHGTIKEFVDADNHDFDFSSSTSLNNSFAADIANGKYSYDYNKCVSKWWTAPFNTRINTLPIRAYEFIYDEYFRDQNWIEVNPYTDFTRNGIEHYQTADQRRYFLTRKKAWAHDPWTSALPGPQRGDAIRYLTDAPIRVSTDTFTAPAGTTFEQVRSLSTGQVAQTVGGSSSTSGTYSELFVDLSAATIESFRFANALQRYRELFARSGGRYVEWQKGVMGATISDIEDERPIYLYGSRNPIQTSEVVQTSSTNVESGQPLGDLAGRAIFVGKGDYIEFVTPDDGYLVQIICAVPHLSYQSGIAPMFTRHNWLDYPIPMFAQLGEEQVKVQSLWFTGNSDYDEASFGYQSRYWEWKYSHDITTGQFQDSLDYWTFTRIFDSEPVNGKDFIEVNVDYRQFAVQDPGVHHIYVSLYNDIQKNIQLPIFGIPTL